MLTACAAMFACTCSTLGRCNDLKTSLLKRKIPDDQSGILLFSLQEEFFAFGPFLNCLSECAFRFGVSVYLFVDIYLPTDKISKRNLFVNNIPDFP